MTQLPQGASQTGRDKVGPHLWPIGRDWQGLNMKIPVHEGCCVYDVSPHYRVCRFWKLVQIGATANPPTPTLSTARDRKPIGIQTRTTDHSPAGLFPTSEWRRGRTSDKNMSKSPSKRHFWGHVISSKKFGRCFCRNKYLKISYFISFPVFWGQSWPGQLWPHPVQLGLNSPIFLTNETQCNAIPDQPEHWICYSLWFQSWLEKSGS